MPESGSGGAERHGFGLAHGFASVGERQTREYFWQRFGVTQPPMFFEQSPPSGTVKNHERKIIEWRQKR